MALITDKCKMFFLHKRCIYTVFPKASFDSGLFLQCRFCAGLLFISFSGRQSENCPKGRGRNKAEFVPCRAGLLFFFFFLKEIVVAICVGVEE